MIGFIGFGKAGSSLANYFQQKGIAVSGFFSRHKTQGNFTFFPSADELAKESDILFLTVTDSTIHEVWNDLDKTILTDKIVCHCSGSLTSDVFTGANPKNICSVHPLLAFNSRMVPAEQISRAFFTLEGGTNAIREISLILDHCGNPYRVINAADKIKYHTAACFASNFTVAVCAKAFTLLEQCGFSQKDALQAFTPLIEENARHVCESGISGALTGPVCRGDLLTVRKHLAELDEETAQLYKALSRVLALESGHLEFMEELK